MKYVGAERGDGLGAVIECDARIETRKITLLTSN